MDREKFLIELKSKAIFYCKYLWGMDFDGEVRINNRLRSTYAWIFPEDNLIEFNKIFLTINADLIIDEMLLHELCHWKCIRSKQNYDDGDFDFEKEIYTVGSRSTNMVFITEDNAVEVKNSQSWFYCKKCSDSKEHYNISLSERVNHYKKHQLMARPLCPVCSQPLNYYCEVDLEEEWVEWYPRPKLVKLNNLYKEYIKEKVI